MFRASRSGDDPSSRVLNSLQLVEIRGRRAVKHRVAVNATITLLSVITFNIKCIPSAARETVTDGRLENSASVRGGGA